MTTWQRETEHVDRGIDHMAGPWQEGEFPALLVPILEEIQRLEDSAWDLFDQRFLDRAEGVWLGILAAIVGVPEIDEPEAVTRLRVRLHMAALLSKQRAADIRGLLDLIPDVAFRLTEASGWVIVTQTGGVLASSAALLRALRVASADGRGVSLVTLEGDEHQHFYWGGADGTPGIALGSADGAIPGAPARGARST